MKKNEGNAKTVRNDNSSRFGKYMEIEFDVTGAPVGGKVTNYLLEKSRVITRAEGERSFHVFYFLLKGAPEKLLKELFLTRNPSDYTFLKQGECFTIDSFDDSKEFKRVLEAMETLGFTEKDKETYWKLLASILLLGNLEIEEQDRGQHHAAFIKNEALVGQVAQLLEIEKSSLLQALTTKTLLTGQKLLNVPQHKAEACISRDSFAKDLYSALFDLIVAQINKSIKVSSQYSDTQSIGVLDIYGFEIFDNNSFEQFCINFCNEKLQQYVRSSFSFFFLFPSFKPKNYSL